MSILPTLVAAARDVARIPGEARRHAPRPPRSGLVVEVGGGQSPHPRADVVVEKYVVDDFERPGEAALSFEKPIVVGDGHRLPLADHSAAYVLAVHVLEHATDPEAFAAELARVAPAGFVQLPSREAELTYGWPYHPWLVDLVGGRLVFEPRNGRSAPVGEAHHRAFAESGLARLAHAARLSTWQHSIEWRGELALDVRGRSAAERTAAVDLDATYEALARARVPMLPDEALRALACPACRVPISFLPGRDDTATCPECLTAYPVTPNGVPILLPAQD